MLISPSLLISFSTIPGLIVFTKISPMLTAIAVVTIYNPIVFEPMRDNLLVSERDATPVIREDTTNGTAISFKRFKKIVPNGEIKFDVKSDHPLIELTTP